MHAEDGALDDGGDGHEIKGLVEVVPGIDVAILLADFIIEAVHVVDVPGLVVAPQQDYAIGPLQFIEEEQGDGFDRIVSPIHEVSDHYQSGVGARIGFACLLQHLQHIVELPV